MENKNDEWRTLFKLGGFAAFLIAALLIGEVIVFALYPRPESVLAHFELFEENWLIGLLTMDLLGILSYLLFIPVSLALYVVLRKYNQTVVPIGMLLFFLGIADFLATNTAFSVLSLSREYSAASNETEKESILAAGRAMFTLFNENAFLVSYVLVSTAWLMISSVMLRTTLFSKLTGYAGVLAGAFGIIAVLLEHVSELKGVLYTAIGFYFGAIIFLFIWVLQIGVKFYKIPVNTGSK